MIKTKQITITIILLITILSTFTSAVDIPLNAPTPKPSITTDQLLVAVNQEGVKTRTELTNYVDKKLLEVTATVKTDGQKFIDDNFRILDQRMHELATIFVIKITIGVAGAIIFASLIVMLVWRMIKKKESKRPTAITRDEYALMKAGMITLDYKKKLEKEMNQNYETPPIPEFQNTQPQPPSIEQIQTIIKLKRKQEEEAKAQKEAKKLEKERQKQQKKYEEQLKDELIKAETPSIVKKIFKKELTKEEKDKRILLKTRKQKEKLEKAITKQEQKDKEVQELQQQQNQLIEESLDLSITKQDKESD